MGRAEAAADAGGAGRARAALLRLGGGQGAAGDPLARGRVRRAAAGGGSAAARARARQALPGPAAGGLPAGRRAALARRAGQPEACAGPGRRCGRRHPALRAHDGRRRRERAHPVRAGGRARPAGGHALRRERRPAEPPRRDAGLPHPAPGAAGPRHRLAPDVDAFDGQLLRVQADPADGRGAGARGGQPADQHHAAGPPRQLPQAPRHDARARADGRRHQRRLRPRLRDGPVVPARLGRHARSRADGPARGADDLAGTACAPASTR